MPSDNRIRKHESGSPADRVVLTVHLHPIHSVGGRSKRLVGTPTPQRVRQDRRNNSRLPRLTIVNWVTDFDNNKTTVVESGFYKGEKADIAVTKDDGLETYLPGMDVTYTIVLTNNGPNAAENVTFVDDTPANTTITSWECQVLGNVTCPNESGAGDINEIIPLFPVGTEFRYTVNMTISLLKSGDLVNTASIAADTEDPDVNNNNASDTDAQQPLTPFLLNSDGSATYTPGTQAFYHVILANPTGSTISNFTFTDSASAGTTMSWTCQDLGMGNEYPADSGSEEINTSISSLSGGHALYFVVTIDTPSSFTGDLVHTAAVDSDSFDPKSVTDTDTQYSVADLSVTVAGSENTYTPGTTTTYTVKAANAGPSDAHNAIVKSSAQAQTTITEWTCTASSGADCPNSSGAESDPDTTNNSANAVKTRITYTLTYIAGAGGTIAGATPQTVEHGADGTAVEAVPNTGYHFVKWNDDSTTNPRTDANVTADISVTALFEVTPPSDNSYLLWTK